MKKAFLIILLVPFLTNCSQYTAMVGPTITLAETGNVLQATSSLSSSLAMNKLKKNIIAEINNQNICPTTHSSELSEIFFETLEQMDCEYDPMSIYR